MHDLPGRDAIIVRQALMRESSNTEAATEVICSRTPSQIQVFKQHYHAKFGHTWSMILKDRHRGIIKR